MKWAVLPLALWLLVAQLHLWQANTLAGLADKLTAAEPVTALLMLERAKMMGQHGTENAQGVALLRMGKSKEAIDYLHAAMDERPTPEVLTNLGVAYLQHGDRESAGVLLEMATLYDGRSERTRTARNLLRAN